MIKKYLCAPGPTAVPPEVMNRMSAALIHHRTPQFSETVNENAELLKKIFRTDRPVLTLSSSGTGAMEASVSQFMKKDSTMLVLSAGKFGERFAQIGRSYGVNVIEEKAEYGSDIKPERVAEILKTNPEIEGVYTEYSETSTGVAFDVKGIAEVVAKTDAVFVVDGITAIGAMEFDMDGWGIDVAIAGAQKSFMIPPGLAFIAYSEKAEKKAEISDLSRYYFDLIKEAGSEAKSTTAWTPAITLYLGLNEALKMMTEEGIGQIVRRHEIVAESFRKGVQAIGLELFVKPDVRPSNSVTSVKVPSGVEGGKIPSMMRDRFGVTIAGGQGSMKGNIFRLGHLGYTDKSDVMIELQSLEMTLIELGYSFETGKSLMEAQKKLTESKFW